MWTIFPVIRPMLTLPQWQGVLERVREAIRRERLRGDFEVEVQLYSFLQSCRIVARRRLQESLLTLQRSLKINGTAWSPRQLPREQWKLVRNFLVSLQVSMGALFRSSFLSFAAPTYTSDIEHEVRVQEQKKQQGRSPTCYAPMISVLSPGPSILLSC